MAAFGTHKDSTMEYRWRSRHRNGIILADSGEGYASKSGARENIESVKRAAVGAEADTVDGG